MKIFEKLHEKKKTVFSLKMKIFSRKIVKKCFFWHKIFQIFYEYQKSESKFYQNKMIKSLGLGTEIENQNFSKF